MNKDQFAETDLAVQIQWVRPRRGLPIPGYESDGAAGIDLRAWLEEDLVLAPGETALVPTGLAVAIPEGYEAQVRPRSGLALNHAISLPNSPGTIDSDYRGEIRIILINHGKESFTVEHGMRIAQMVISPVIQVIFRESEELPVTSRGAGGFGSTGR